MEERHLIVIIKALSSGRWEAILFDGEVGWLVGDSKCLPVRLMARALASAASKLRHLFAPLDKIPRRGFTGYHAVLNAMGSSSSGVRISSATYGAHMFIELD